MSQRFTEAITFAAEHHEGQKRKASGLPYILHPLEVGIILSGLTNDEDIIIAGVLHDTVDICGVTLDELKERFGERVAYIVAGETEPEVLGSAEDTWKLRKAHSLELLKNTDDIAIHMLWLADKLANMRGINRIWCDEGDKLFSRFTHTDKREHEWYYRTVAKYTRDLCDTAAYEEYEHLINKVFY